MASSGRNRDISRPDNFRDREIPGSVEGTEHKETSMRIIAVALTAMLTVSLIETQAFAANPDRTYYQGAGACHGKAYCSYRAKMVKHPKK
jgi:hypothetical protein